MLTTYSWPGGNNATSDKVPSEIAYVNVNDSHSKQRSAHQSTSTETDGEEWSLVLSDLSLEDNVKPAVTGPSIRWGFQLRPDEDRFRCMKLFLDQDQNLPSFVSRSDMLAELVRSGKDATEVVADYLRAINEHTRSELVKRYGSYFVETTELQWIFTVPAVWSDAAKNATLTAAKEAGMGPDLTLISEPEAAAVYTLQAIQPNHLKEHDNFVVCDAGGGTVDLISYEIKKVRPLRIEESAEGSGACCGAAMLNIKFEELVRSKLGNTDFNSMCRDKSRTWLMAMKHFEDYVKRNYDPASPDDFNVPFPGVADDISAGIEQGFLTLTANEIAGMFGPIITEIIHLVEGQMAKLESKGKTVAGVVLVGGFGQSRCLYKILKNKFATPSNHQSALTSTHVAGSGSRFEVMQPANAWTAVVRGAVLRGLEGVELVLSRKSRRHYGVRYRAPFDSNLHPLSCKEWDKFNGEYMAVGRMNWFIR